MSQPDNEKFIMTEPQAIGKQTRFAFWLTAEEARFFAVAQQMNCVAAVSEPQNNKALVEISNDHDPDEAWHWIRTELEEESHVVELDQIWKDALWLL